MRYVALLRGINVGGNRRVEMKRLKALFESLGCTDVSTYINSGNVMFASKAGREGMRKAVEEGLRKEFGFDIPALVKTGREMSRIAEAIPEDWQNDAAQRTDVAYVFPELDHPKILGELPLERKLVDVRYTKGAVFWNMRRKDYRESRLNRLIGHEAYRNMTVRNVRTARYLGGLGR